MKPKRLKQIMVGFYQMRLCNSAGVGSLPDDPHSGDLASKRLAEDLLQHKVVRLVKIGINEDMECQTFCLFDSVACTNVQLVLHCM